MAAAVATEVEAFLSLARERLATEGWRASDWVETGLRAALLQDGRRLLADLLNDPTLPLPGDASGPGEKCTCAVERAVETLFGPLTVRRNYYHTAATGEGRYPLDEALKLVGPYTPALARLMSRAGAQTGFESGSEDLRVYGGLAIQGRQIHRLMQIVGPAVHRAMEAAPNETVAAPIPVLYVEVDGTGAPMVPAELAGEYFEVGANARFLASVSRVRPAYREKFASAILGGDYVRVHTVAEEDNPLYWRLLHAAAEPFGLPVLYNTSFNLFGDPLVCTPRDAVRSFYSSGIDAMIAGYFFLEK